jgi:hypothetical protein
MTQNQQQCVSCSVRNLTMTPLHSEHHSTPTHTNKRDMDTYHEFLSPRDDAVCKESKVRSEFHGTMSLNVSIVSRWFQQVQQNSVHLMEHKLCFRRNQHFLVWACKGASCPISLPEVWVRNKRHQKVCCG